MDASDVSPFARSRAKTVQSVAITETVDSDALPLSMDEEDQDSGPDLFEITGSSEAAPGEEREQDEEVSVLSRGIKGQPEELPIELISLTERFVNSLSAKVHSSPPTVEKISNLYQDFYVKAESHIATHISALASRINRDPSPQAPIQAPRGSAQSKLNNKGAESVVPSRQMLTASEVAEKRQARKLLASKRIALEEAVERRACESIYGKLWRHKSTLDEVRDEKLRSKTAALLLIGINLKDLGVDVDMTTIGEERQKEVDEGLSLARDCLAKMNEEKFPLGKLHHLAASHKAIVDVLTKLLPSSSSADEILPTLIYTLVTCPPEGINVISNLFFIQRFRSSSKIDGETAYCLTNLEAAISFLENVELSELRSEDLPERASLDGPPSLEAIEPLPIRTEAPVSSVTTGASGEFSNPTSKEDPSNTLPRPQQSVTAQQRLNNLFQPPSKVLEAANDAVRNTADQGLKNIGATLDSSFNFLFGRLKELQSSQPPGKEGSNPVLPKTLAEARLLVTSPDSTESNSGDDNTLQTPIPTDRHSLRRMSSKDAFLGLVTGQRTPRDRSVDSARTQGSSKRTGPGVDSTKNEPSPGFSQGSTASLPPTPLESMRNFGNTLNPLNHIPGMIRSFGRPGPDGPGGLSVPSEKTRTVSASREAPSASPGKIDPPIQRFLETQNVNDLTIRDVSTLLEDYKRIAALFLKQDSNSK
ncbi:hypothetical protein EYZ11_012054 [Aspergillus tanneri]|uniref:VPS9 domain-containing protein n=1 Tax=Aspergillus tanneri TaxID=1220188 RepID=A0A4S3J1H7_9EURO|nr:uncharacterized protein ATNIH1004_003284 [Aspergillus tanneri]KAA8650597.1 hypothetical protein ATNIH1004_003284 [Aspergillus tanneri]THC88495.1 hypothetical protein EYZ11_012054 [Aspergillus tanneri]